jgi:hypothetical protein
MEESSNETFGAQLGAEGLLPLRLLIKASQNSSDTKIRWKFQRHRYQVRGCWKPKTKLVVGRLVFPENLK